MKQILKQFKKELSDYCQGMMQPRAAAGDIAGLARQDAYADIDERVGLSEEMPTEVESNELEEEAKRIWDENFNGGHFDVIGYTDFLEFARHFAEWQKKRDEEDLTYKIAAAYQLGLSDRERKMMKGAVEAEEVGRNVTNCPIYLAKIPVDTTKHGDKVKLIIIPQDDESRDS